MKRVRAICSSYKVDLCQEESTSVHLISKSQCSYSNLCLVCLSKKIPMDLNLLLKFPNVCQIEVSVLIPIWQVVTFFSTWKNVKFLDPSKPLGWCWKRQAKCGKNPKAYYLRSLKEVWISTLYQNVNLETVLLRHVKLVKTSKILNLTPQNQDFMGKPAFWGTLPQSIPWKCINSPQKRYGFFSKIQTLGSSQKSINLPSTSLC
jgi:hypothetical protein